MADDVEVTEDMQEHASFGILLHAKALILQDPHMEDDIAIQCLKRMGVWDFVKHTSSIMAYQYANNHKLTQILQKRTMNGEYSTRL